MRPNLPLAIGAILFTVFALSFGDALIKMIGTRMGLAQMFVLRSTLVLIVLAGLISVRHWGARFWPNDAGWVILRSAMLVAMWVLYYRALAYVPLATAAAAYYTLPLFITLFSAWFVGTPVGRLGWLAVALGFLGVLIVLRPHAGSFSPYVLLPLLAAMLYAGAMILTGTKCAKDHPLTLALWLNISFVIAGAFAEPLFGAIGAVVLAQSWSPMGLWDWATIAVLATTILIGGIGTAIAYQAGPAHVVGTFDFAYVAFALIWGAVFFGEAPDVFTVTGFVLIVAAGVLSLRASPHP